MDQISQKFVLSMTRNIEGPILFPSVLICIISQYFSSFSPAYITMNHVFDTRFGGSMSSDIVSLRPEKLYERLIVTVYYLTYFFIECECKVSRNIRIERSSFLLLFMY